MTVSYIVHWSANGKFQNEHIFMITAMLQDKMYADDLSIHISHLLQDPRQETEHILLVFRGNRTFWGVHFKKANELFILTLIQCMGNIHW